MISMLIKQFSFLSLLCVHLIQAQDSNEVLDCPEITYLQGNTLRISALSYLMDSSMFCAMDENLIVYFYDIKTGVAKNTISRINVSNTPVFAVTNPNGVLISASKTHHKILDYMSNFLYTSSSNAADFTTIGLFNLEVRKSSVSTESTMIFQSNKVTLVTQAKTILESAFLITSYDYKFAADSSKFPDETFTKLTPSAMAFKRDHPCDSIPQFLFASLRNKINIAIFYSSTSYIYGYVIDTTLSTVSRDFGDVAPFRFNYELKLIEFVNNTNAISITFGKAILTTQDQSLAYKSCFYNINLIKSSSINSYVIDFTDVFATPFSCTAFSSTDPIVWIKNIYFNSKSYTFFGQNTTFFIYQNETLIKNNFSLSNKLTFSIVNVSAILSIPQTPIMIMGTTKGRIMQFNMSNLITTSDISGIVTTTPTFKYQLYGLGNYINLYCKIDLQFIQLYNYTDQASVADVYVSDTRYIYGVSDKIDQTTFQQQQIVQYDLQSSSSTLKVFNHTKGLLISSTLMIGPNHFYTFLQNNTNYAIRTNTGGCQNKTTNPSLNIYQTSQAKLFQYYQGTTKYIELNFFQLNLNFIKLLGMKKYKFNETDYLVIAIYQSNFQYGQNCFLNVTNPDAQAPSDTYSIQIQIYKALSAEKVFQTKSNFYTQQIDNQNYKDMGIDEKGTIALVLSDRIIFFNPTLSTISNQESQEYKTAVVFCSDLVAATKTDLQIGSDQTSLTQFFFIPTIKQFQLRVVTSALNFIVFFKYNQQWYNVDQQLTYSFLSTYPKVSTNTFLKTSTYYQGENTLYLDYSKLLIICSTDKLFIYKYNDQTGELTAYLFVRAFAITNSIFWFDYNKLNSNSFNSIYAISKTLEIKKINLKSCAQTSCMQMICKKETNMNQQFNSNYEDIYNPEIDKNRAPNTLIRQEELTGEIYSFSIHMQQLRFITILMKINLYESSYYKWDILHNTFENELTQFTDIVIHQQVSTIPAVLSDNKGLTPLKNAKIFYNYKYTFDSFWSVGFFNIDWLISQDMYKDITDRLFRVSVQYFTIDNFNVIMTDNLSQPINPENKLITFNTLFFNLTQSYNFKMKNIVYSQKQFFNSSFIRIYLTSSLIELQNIRFENSVLQDYKLVQSMEDTSIKLTNITFNNNKILFQNFDQTNFLFQGNVFTYNYLEITNNILYNMIFHGPTSTNKNKQGKLSLIKIQNNKIFSQQAKGDVSILLDMSYSSLNQDIAEFYFENSIISHNQIYFKEYNDSLQYSPQQISCISDNLDSSYSLFQNQVSLNNKFGKLYFIQIKEILQIQIKNINITENGQSDFFLFQNMRNLSIYNINFNDDAICPGQDTGSLMQIVDFQKLKLEMSNITISNKFIKDKSIIQIQSLSQDINDSGQVSSSITLSNFTLSNLVIQTTNSFVKASVLNLYTQGKLMTNIDTFQSEKTLFITPHQVFSNIASNIIVDTPISSLVISNIQIQKMYNLSPKVFKLKQSIYSLFQLSKYFKQFKKHSFYSKIYNVFSNKLPFFQIKQEAIFFNTQVLILQNSTFQNNQYDSLIPKKGYNGGFLKINSPNCKILNVNFRQSQAYQGSALQITPSQKNSFFQIKNCSFEDLISLKQGGAIYINDITEQTIVQIEDCNFKQNLSPNGGSIYIQFFTDQNANREQNIDIFPKINLYNIQASNSFSPGGQGSFFYSESLVVLIDKFIILSNDPKASAQESPIFDEKFQSSQQIGSYFNLLNSYITISNLEGTNFDIILSRQTTSFIHPIFLYASQYSEVTLNTLKIKESFFGKDGFILIASSKLTIDTFELSQIQFKNEESKRILEDSSNLFSSEGFTSSIILKENSIFKIQSLSILNNTCLSNICLGGTILIQESSGELVDSTFSGNQCSQNGGALAILNPSSSIYLNNLKFEENSSQQKGGSLFISVDKSLQRLISISSTTVYQNQAKIGGGLYIQKTNTNTDSSENIIELLNLDIRNNQAVEMGGGIQFHGINLFIDSSVLIKNNTASSGFGGDYFSYPKQLKLDYQLTKASNTQDFQFEKCQKFTGNQDCHRLGMQVSGQILPNIIFHLIDDLGFKISDQYQFYINEIIQLNIVKQSGEFILPQYAQSFIHNKYFNLTGINIIGIPNDTIQLKITCPQINVEKSQEEYFIILEIYFRHCQQGEIYVKKTDTDEKITKEFFICEECPAGTYSLINQQHFDSSIECKKCPIGAQCLGGSRLSLSEGYWRIDDQSDRIFQCYNKPSNCLGGEQNQTCAEGLIGPLCEICDLKNGFTTNGSYECFKCEDIQYNTLKVTLALFFFILLMSLAIRSVLQRLMQAYKIKKTITNDQNIEQLEQSSSIILKQIVNYLQILVILSQFGMSTPQILDKTLETFANPTNQALYSMECFYYELQVKYHFSLIYIRIIGQLFTPVFFMLTFSIYGVIAYRKYKINRNIYLITSFLYTLVYFQPWVFKQAINSITCRKIDEVDYIQAYILEECFTDDYNYYSLVFVVPIILCIAVVIPGIVLAIIFKNKQYPRKQKYFNFMIGEYKKDCQYWEFIKLNVKLLLMVVLTIFDQEPQNKILFVLLVVCTYGWITIYKQPFKLQAYNKIEQTSLKVLIVSFFLGFISIQNKENFFIWIVSFASIGLINLIFIVWVVTKLVKSYNIFFKNIKNKLILYLTKKRYFRIFCFRKKRKAKDLWALWLHSIIQQRKKNKALYNQQVAVIYDNFKKNVSVDKIDEENIVFNQKQSTYKFIEQINSRASVSVSSQKLLVNGLINSQILNSPSIINKLKIQDENDSKYIFSEDTLRKDYIQQLMTLSPVQKSNNMNFQDQEYLISNSFQLSSHQKEKYIPSKYQSESNSKQETQQPQVFQFEKNQIKSNLNQNHAKQQSNQINNKFKPQSQANIKIQDFQQQSQQDRKCLTEQSQDEYTPDVELLKEGYEIIQSSKQSQVTPNQQQNEINEQNIEINQSNNGVNEQNNDDQISLNQLYFSQLDEHDKNDQSQFEDKIQKIQQQEKYKIFTRDENKQPKS